MCFQTARASRPLGQAAEEGDNRSVGDAPKTPPTFKNGASYTWDQGQRPTMDDGMSKTTYATDAAVAPEPACPCNGKGEIMQLDGETWVEYKPSVYLFACAKYEQQQEGNKLTNKTEDILKQAGVTSEEGEPETMKVEVLPKPLKKSCQCQKWYKKGSFWKGAAAFVGMAGAATAVDVATRYAFKDVKYDGAEQEQVATEDAQNQFANGEITVQNEEELLNLVETSYTTETVNGVTKTDIDYKPDTQMEGEVDMGILGIAFVCMAAFAFCFWFLSSALFGGRQMGIIRIFGLSGIACCGTGLIILACDNSLSYSEYGNALIFSNKELEYEAAGEKLGEIGTEVNMMSVLMSSGLIIMAIGLLVGIYFFAKNKKWCYFK